MKKLGVPGGGEANSLGEDRGNPGSRDAVQTFIPPVVGGDLQARDRGRYVLHLRDFFVQGHPRDEVRNPRIGGERRIEISRRRRVRCVYRRNRLLRDGRKWKNE